jgi:hypothetical protein
MATQVGGDDQRRQTMDAIAAIVSAPRSASKSTSVASKKPGRAPMDKAERSAFTLIARKLPCNAEAVHAFWLLADEMGFAEPLPSGATCAAEAALLAFDSRPSLVRPALDWLKKRHSDAYEDVWRNASRGPNYVWSPQLLSAMLQLLAFYVNNDVFCYTDVILSCLYDVALGNVVGAADFSGFDEAAVVTILRAVIGTLGAYPPKSDEHCTCEFAEGVAWCLVATLIERTPSDAAAAALLGGVTAGGIDALLASLALPAIDLHYIAAAAAFMCCRPEVAVGHTARVLEQLCTRTHDPWCSEEELAKTAPAVAKLRAYVAAATK